MIAVQEIAVLGRIVSRASMAPVKATDGLWRHAEEFDEGAPHALGVGEANRLRNQLDRLRALL
jgi:hypothetical protein